MYAIKDSVWIIYSELVEKEYIFMPAQYYTRHPLSKFTSRQPLSQESSDLVSAAGSHDFSRAQVLLCRQSSRIN